MVASSSAAFWATRLAIAWAVGAGASAFGLFASYRWDFPSGPAIVCALGLALVGFGAWRGLARIRA